MSLPETTREQARCDALATAERINEICISLKEETRFYVLAQDRELIDPIAPLICGLLNELEQAGTRFRRSVNLIDQLEKTDAPF